MLDFIVAMQNAVQARVAGFRKDEGATAVEYGLMVALIAGVIIFAVTQLGSNVSESFTDTCNAIGDTVDNAANCAPTP